MFALGLGLTIPFSVSANSALQTIEQKASYTLASDLAKNFQDQGLNIDTQAFMLGLEDVLNKRPAKLTDQEMMEAITAVKKQMLEKQQADRAAEAEKNVAEGKAYLTKNGKNPEVTTLDNGIQYKVLKQGAGESPSEADTIFAHYEGKFINGEVFDSSFQRGTPLKFEMSNVIQGWGEVLKLMKPGDKWEVAIPANLAYGAKGAGDRIGPNKTLIFIIELIQFDKAQ